MSQVVEGNKPYWKCMAFAFLLRSKTKKTQKPSNQKTTTHTHPWVLILQLKCLSLGAMSKISFRLSESWCPDKEMLCKWTCPFYLLSVSSVPFAGGSSSSMSLRAGAQTLPGRLLPTLAAGGPLLCQIFEPLTPILPDSYLHDSVFYFLPVLAQVSHSCSSKYLLLEWMPEVLLEWYIQGGGGLTRVARLGFLSSLRVFYRMKAEEEDEVWEVPMAQGSPVNVRRLAWGRETRRALG